MRDEMRAMADQIRAKVRRARAFSLCRARVRARVRACVRECVCVRVCVYQCVRNVVCGVWVRLLMRRWACEPVYQFVVGGPLQGSMRGIIHLI